METTGQVANELANALDDLAPGNTTSEQIRDQIKEQSMTETTTSRKQSQPERIAQACADAAQALAEQGIDPAKATADQAINALPDYEGEVSKTERGKFGTAWRKAQRAGTFNDTLASLAFSREDAPKKATANGDNKRTGSKPKEKKPEKAAPEGYEFKLGSDIEEGNVVLLNSDPEVMVSITEVVENDRPYLRIVLGSTTEQEKTRKRGISPSKKYAVHTTDRRIIAVEKD
jgi:hypothetical protein